MNPKTLSFRRAVMAAGSLLAGLTAEHQASAQVVFQTIPATGDLASMVTVTALSQDGSAICGSGWSLTNWSPKAFLWKQASGTQPIDVPSARSSLASDVNNSGTVVAGWCFKSSGGVFIWNNGTFTTPSQKVGAVIRALSTDGATAYGSNPTNKAVQTGVAAQWTASSGAVTSLGDLTGGATESEVLAVSADKTTTVGWGKSASGVEAFRRRGSTMTGLGSLGGGKFFSEATAVSADGSLVAGRSSSAGGMQAFRWTATNGMTGLGDLPGGAFHSEATGVSGDGSIIVGTSDSAADTEMFVWESGRGMRSLSAILNAAGVDLTGWRFTYCKPVISEDGNVIAGQGIAPDYEPVIWRLAGLRSILDTLPSPKVALAPAAGAGTNVAIKLDVVAEAGFRYQVQSCDQLGSGTWTNSGAPLVGDGMNHTLSFEKPASSRFWRMVVTPPPP
jgi:probable HAF family extracellular repeat protein